ncbi:MAG TPA: acyl transferase [Chitinophagaceae bacterium]|nr:acyl transferase [Chitinophagaceae bacterium]
MYGSEGRNYELEEKIFHMNEEEFESVALTVFREQSQQVKCYAEFIQAIGCDPYKVQQIESIPFLPVSVFKTHSVIGQRMSAEVVFESSGTTKQIPSRHLVASTNLYQRSFLTAFQQQYGAPSSYLILALLPSYLERGHSSLVYMMQELIQLSGHPKSGFFLNEYEKLAQILKTYTGTNQKVLLIGVTYALLDFARLFPQPLQQVIVMETGGMKGRQQELTRFEVHQQLKSAFQVTHIASEYGMTELLSQAYAPEEGWYRSPHWMKMLVRDEYDPFFIQRQGKGLLNIIDLANLYSCSFLAVDDYGLVMNNGRFQVMGRSDRSELRGCSLMYI